MARRQQSVFPGGCREQAGVLCQAQVWPGGIICKVPVSPGAPEGNWHLPAGPASRLPWLTPWVSSGLRHGRSSQLVSESLASGVSQVCLLTT